MTIPVVLTGGGGEATVTHAGQLHVAPYAYDLVSNHEMSVINTAYNFFKPRVGYNFVITGIMIATDRNVGANGSRVELFTAHAADTSVRAPAEGNILHVDLVKQTNRDVLPLNILIAAGHFINATCSDNNVDATITGYYITVENIE